MCLGPQSHAKTKIKLPFVTSVEDKPSRRLKEDVIAHWKPQRQNSLLQNNVLECRKHSEGFGGEEVALWCFSVVFGLLCGTRLLGNERIKRISRNMSSFYVFCLLIFRKTPTQKEILLQKDEHLHKSPCGVLVPAPAGGGGSIYAFEMHTGTEINKHTRSFAPLDVVLCILTF